MSMPGIDVLTVVSDCNQVLQNKKIFKVLDKLYVAKYTIDDIKIYKSLMIMCRSSFDMRNQLFSMQKISLSLSDKISIQSYVETSGYQEAIQLLLNSSKH